MHNILEQCEKYGIKLEPKLQEIADLQGLLRRVELDRQFAEEMCEVTAVHDVVVEKLRDQIEAVHQSVAHFNSLTILPVNLSDQPWPVGIVTLKKRTLSPVVERFIECAREVTKPNRKVVVARAYETKSNVS